MRKLLRSRRIPIGLRGIRSSPPSEKEAVNSRGLKKVSIPMLIRILHDLINLLMIVNIGCALFALAAAARHQTLIVWDWMDEPGWRWWSSGNVFSSSLAEKYWPRRRQLITLVLAFLAALVVHIPLSWLYALTSTRTC
jgi:hypothetical protein